MLATAAMAAASSILCRVSLIVVFVHRGLWLSAAASAEFTAEPSAIRDIPPTPFKREYENFDFAPPGRGVLIPGMERTTEEHTAEAKRSLTTRVRKVAGQLRAIERMIEEDRDCSEILTQLVSARRGLKSLAENVIQGHLRHCVGESRTNAEAQRKLRDMLTVLERYVE